MSNKVILHNTYNISDIICYYHEYANETESITKKEIEQYQKFIQNITEQYNGCSIVFDIVEYDIETTCYITDQFSRCHKVNVQIFQ